MNPLVGTGALVRLALRRDRLMLPLWIVAIGGMTVSVASSIGELYPTAESRQAIAASIGRNPAILAMTGPTFDMTSVGGIVAWRSGGFIAVLAALMSIFLVVRHTRAEEESGRLELVGSTVVGRYAALTAGVTVAVAANLVIGAVVALGLIGQGLPSAGALALGLSTASAGLVFAGLACLTAQLTGTSRGANGIAGAALAATYLFRAIGDSAGDTGPDWLSWLSPIGWAQQVRPFAGERWWVYALPGATVVVLGVLAYALVSRRDLGGALLPPRLGRAEASRGLSSPYGLAWRLQRTPLLWWTLGFTLAGAAYGSVAYDIGDLVDDSPQLAAIFERLGGRQGLVDGFFGTTLGLIGLVAAAYAVQATLRLRSEEVAQRAEPVLATGVGRVRWAASHVVIALAGSALLLAAAGAAEGLVHGVRVGDVAGELPRLAGAALVRLPAVWLVAAVAVVLFGLLPRFVAVSWVVVVGCVFLSQFGQLLELEQWLIDLSPFSHVPNMPGEELRTAPLLWLSAVSAGLLTVGFAGFRRRDLAG